MAQEIQPALNPPFFSGDWNYQRYLTHTVHVGTIGIGGKEPIRLQSMTTTDTMDIEATVQQSIRMIERGCELVRITAPSIKEAKSLELIKSELIAKGYNAPLVADIHFTPNAAEVAADYVEKVRVNPGNYADKKKFEVIDYSDEGYAAELERIRSKFTPLVLKCKALGRAMRIGTNHGSLSDRIMSRYGDTPLGMVESALEFIRICREHNYHDLIISMKASNPQVMIQAYRLLVLKMNEELMNYPLHLGVTEAGEGEDGRIKSAVGIGTLLEDGIGDTIRVSLTEEPEEEIPVAKILADRYKNRGNHKSIPFIAPAIDPYTYTRRHCHEVGNFGGKEVPRIIVDFSQKDEITAASLFGAGYSYSVPLDKWNISDQACDYIFVGDKTIDFQIPGTLGVIVNFNPKNDSEYPERHFPILSADDFISLNNPIDRIHFIESTIEDVDKVIATKKINTNSILVLKSNNAHAMPEMRAATFKVMHAQVDIPIVYKREYENLNLDEFQIYSSTDLGALLVDGLGDGIFISAPTIPMKAITSTAFGILQATRLRISRTEYISCPSCGRTLFDLQETTAKIRKRTDHLKGLKIGIMGCIVNGPGEMADADYGYVGTGPGKITLYKEKEVVKRNVPSASAVDELIDLIKNYGDWVEPES